MKTTSKWLGIAMAMVLALNVGLFAAGGQEEATGPAGEPSGELDVFLEPSQSVMNVVNEAFGEEYPNIKLNYSSSNATEYETVLKTRLAAGDHPDLMTFWPNARTADPARRGLIMDLTDTAYAERLVPSLRSEAMYQGKVWGIPVSGEGEGVFINKTLFDEQGLELPTNWDEFLEVAEAFKQSGIQPIASGFQDDWVIMRYTNAAFANLGYGRDPDLEEKLICGEVDFSHPGWVETFDKLVTLVDNGYFGENPLASGHDQALAKFARGEAAMWIMGIWDTTNIRNGMTEEFELVYEALPVNEPGEPRFGMWRAGTITTISARTDNFEAANAYLEVFSDPGVHERFCRDTLRYPVFVDVEVPEIDPATDEYVEKYVVTGQATPGAHYRWPAGMSNNWKKKLQEIVGGQITTSEMVEWLNREYQSMENLYECSR